MACPCDASTSAIASAPAQRSPQREMTTSILRQSPRARFVWECDDLAGAHDSVATKANSDAKLWDSKLWWS
eukprot:2277603-Amphidinium_carterae.1